MKTAARVRRASNGLIRQAEALISEGQFSQAIQILSDARSKEPGNEYIEAIIQRVLLLEERDPRNMSSNDNGNVTVSTPAQAPASTDDTAVQVTRIVSVAKNLFQRGSVEPAFETLMKAYILDPLNEEVIKAEELILPAMEVWKKRGSVAMPQHATPTPVLRERLSSPQQGNIRDMQEPNDRLEQLKRDKEIQRQAKERAMWRKASEPPHSGVPADESPSST